MSAEDNELRALLAHDLKSPLAVIVGYADLLRRRDDEEIRREAPERILEAADRLQSVIDDAVLLLAPPPDRRVRVSVPPPSPNSLNGGHGPRRRILVVDDDPLVRRLLGLTLPPEAYEVVEAPGGASAVELAASERPALILLDWRMPDRAGAEVLTQLNQLDLRVPVIVLTAETDREQHELAHSLGASTSITKPFSPLHLLATVERALAGAPLG